MYKNYVLINGTYYELSGSILAGSTTKPGGFMGTLDAMSKIHYDFKINVNPLDSADANCKGCHKRTKNFCYCLTCIYFNKILLFVLKGDNAFYQSHTVFTVNLYSQCGTEGKCETL